MKRTPTEQKALERAAQIAVELGEAELDRMNAMPQGSPQRILTARRYNLKVAAGRYLEREQRLEAYALYKTLRRSEEMRHYRITWPDDPTKQIRQTLVDEYESLTLIEDSPLVPGYSKHPKSWAKHERKHEKLRAIWEAEDDIRKRGGDPHRTTPRARFQLKPISLFEKHFGQGRPLQPEFSLA